MNKTNIVVLNKVEDFTLKSFGGVMLTKQIWKYRKKPDIMFRTEPDDKALFSRWVLFSFDDPQNVPDTERGLLLSDPQVVLSIAPEVANYLNMLPGTDLVRVEGERIISLKRGNK